MTHILKIWQKIISHIIIDSTDRLSRTDIYPSKERKGLGRHVRKGDPEERFCRGRKILKKGYRSRPRQISTLFGKLDLPVKRAECCNCGVLYSPLLSALHIDRYARREANFEQEVIEAVIDTNYRRLIDGRSIDISLGGIHNIVVGSAWGWVGRKGTGNLES